MNGRLLKSTRSLSESKATLRGLGFEEAVCQARAKADRQAASVAGTKRGEPGVSMKVERKAASPRR